MNNSILVGSGYFFSMYPDFNSKDIDKVQLIDTSDFENICQITGNGECLFLVKKHTNKQTYIDWALKSKMGMVVGKFLVPEFCQEIDLTIDDLLKLKPLLEKLDDKHKYEEIIFNSYVENNSFKLTDEQRELAYQSYKESREIE